MSLKYLIKLKNHNNLFCNADYFACSSENVSDGIMDKLPSHMSKKGDYEHIVITSNDKEFYKILTK